MRDVDRTKIYRPGSTDFVETSATSSASLSLNQYNQGSTGISVFTTAARSDPLPWSNIQGSTIGDATYLGYTQDSFSVVFNYAVGLNPSPATRLQHTYDFTPRVTDGSNGLRRLDFYIGQLQAAAGGLMELELIIEGQWSLGQQTTGGLHREFIRLDPGTVWNIEEDFVYDPQTDVTRFYAWRVSAGVGINDGLQVVGHLIGAPVPTPSVATTMLLLGCLAPWRRRRHVTQPNRERR